jgi:hypothetical protein
MTASSDDPEPTRRSDPFAGGHRHVTQAELAERWRISGRTLDRWRASGTGPAWLKFRGRVLYRVEDVLAYEQARLRQP